MIKTATAIHSSTSTTNRWRMTGTISTKPVRRQVSGTRIGCLPKRNPAHEGAVLDQNLRGKVHPAPPDLARRLPSPPANHRYVAIGGHVGLIDNNYTVNIVKQDLQCQNNSTRAREGAHWSPLGRLLGEAHHVVN
jgi:hypothetical protein